MENLVHPSPDSQFVRVNPERAEVAEEIADWTLSVRTDASTTVAALTTT
jgi:hypothetical protein